MPAWSGSSENPLPGLQTVASAHGLSAVDGGGGGEGDLSHPLLIRSLVPLD